MTVSGSNIQSCKKWAKLLAEFEYPLAPVVTPTGLALYRGDVVDAPQNLRCLWGAMNGDPVIIPYRELEPFMTPGPLRDELLALH
jgi:hypothetical protein